MTHTLRCSARASGAARPALPPRDWRPGGVDGDQRQAGKRRGAAARRARGHLLAVRRRAAPPGQHPIPAEGPRIALACFPLHGTLPFVATWRAIGGTISMALGCMQVSCPLDGPAHTGWGMWEPPFAACGVLGCQGRSTGSLALGIPAVSHLQHQRRCVHVRACMTHSSGSPAEGC